MIFAHISAVPQNLIKKAPQGAHGHRRKHAQLVAAYLQSQSQAYRLGQHGDKTQ